VTVTLTADPAAADGPDAHGQGAYRGRDDAGPASHAAMELAEVLRDAVDDGVLERGDAELIARSRIAGHRVADIARHHHLGSRTLWDRRHRAERTLVAAHTAGTARAS
jgi:hypothetical protein